MSRQVKTTVTESEANREEKEFNVQVNLQQEERTIAEAEAENDVPNADIDDGVYNYPLVYSTDIVT